VTAEQYVALGVALITGVSVILAATLPGQIKSHREIRQNRRENRVDHSKVVSHVDVLAATVDALAGQVSTLTNLVIETASDLKAHTKWEEGQKYVSPEHIEQLIHVISKAEEAP
jgi:hypothetical protein